MIDKTDFTANDLSYVNDLVSTADRRGQPLFITTERIHLLLSRLQAAENLIDGLDSYIGEADLPVETKLLYTAWMNSRGEDAP